MLHFKPSDKKLRPVAFDMRADVNRGLYVNEKGEQISADDIQAEVQKPGRKIVRVTFRVRLRGEAVDKPTHKRTALAVVNGSITPDELNRLIYKLARDQYDKGK